MPIVAQLKQWAKALKMETYALYLCARHPMTPWYAKLLVSGIVAYAISPIDLIPDFIPLLGQLDDIISIPLGIALAIKCIPAPILEECRERAHALLSREKPVSRVAGAFIVLIWILLASLAVLWAYKAAAFGRA